MKNNCYKKLQRYSIATGSLLVASAANGQVTYVDIEPDSTIGVDDFYVLDINEDGNDDVIFQVINETSIDSNTGNVNVGGVGIAPSNTNNYQSFIGFESNLGVGPDFGAASALNDGAAISSSATNWYNIDEVYQNNAMMGANGTVNIGGFPFPANIGDWPGESYKYLGLRITTNGGDTFYGWVRMSMAANASTITLHDFAYNATAGEPIQAGEGGPPPPVTSTTDNLLEIATHVYAAEKNIVIQVTGEIITTGAVATIYTTSGQQVATAPLSSSKTTIPTDNTGLHIVKVVFPDGVVSRKVMVGY